MHSCMRSRVRDLCEGLSEDGVREKSQISKQQWCCGTQTSLGTEFQIHLFLNHHSICTMSKRKVSAALGGQPDDRNTKPRLDADQSSSFLAFPNTSQAHQRKAAVPFQKPTQIMSFSYPPSHIQEFTNSSLRYYVDPPLGANLGYGYDRWIRRPDEKGRLDSLLRAYTRAEDSGTCPVSLNDIAVVCWRGVMTR